MRPEIALAVRHLQAGDLVAFPTETVYGLGADAANPQAVARIFAAKERPADHPLIVHITSAAYLTQWARDIPPIAWTLAEAFWPGPLTLILPRAERVSDVVTGGQRTIGVRVPAHPLALELLHAFAEAGGGSQGMTGLAAPSANRFGRISPTQASHVREELGGKVALILDGGACEVGIESTILDVSRLDALPRILRPGHIRAQMLSEHTELAPLCNPPEEHATPRVSGSLEAHYAPRTPLRLLALDALHALSASPHAEEYAWLTYSTKLTQATAIHLPDTPQGYAQGLYAALRTLDQAQLRQIIVEAPPTDTAWSAIADRLRRAAHGSGQD